MASPVMALGLALPFGYYPCWVGPVAVAFSVLSVLLQHWGIQLKMIDQDEDQDGWESKALNRALQYSKDEESLIPGPASFLGVSILDE